RPGGTVTTANGRTTLLTVEHETVSYVAGPLLVAEQMTGVGYDELVEVVSDGRVRRGRILALEGDRAVVQVLDGTTGLSLPGTRVRTRGEVARVAVGDDLVGRILDGSGTPMDGGPPLRAEEYRDVNGA